MTKQVYKTLKSYFILPTSDLEQIIIIKFLVVSHIAVYTTMTKNGEQNLKIWQYPSYLRCRTNKK